MSEQHFVITSDERKIPVPDKLPQVAAEKIAAKVGKLREYWDAKPIKTPPAPSHK